MRVPRDRGAQDKVPPDVEGLYHACSRRMFATAYRILDDHDSAWDAVHIVFSRLVRPGFSADSLTPGYLLQAARNEALCLRRNSTRSVRNLKRFAGEFDTPETRPGETNEARPTALVRQIQALIEELPPHQRRVLSMRLKGFQNGQIATRLRITVKTVEYHCAKAFRYLRAELPRRGVYRATDWLGGGG